MAREYRCWRCNKRLNVDDVDGRIKVVVYCNHCRAANRLEVTANGATPSFREKVETKSI